MKSVVPSSRQGPSRQGQTLNINFWKVNIQSLTCSSLLQQFRETAESIQLVVLAKLGPADRVRQDGNVPVVSAPVHGKRRAILPAMGMRVVGPAASIGSCHRLPGIAGRHHSPAFGGIAVRGRGLKNDLGQQRQAADGRRPDVRQAQQGLEILGMLLVGTDEDAFEPLLVDVQAQYRMPGRGEERRPLGQPLDLSQQPVGWLPHQGSAGPAVRVGLLGHHVQEQSVAARCPARAPVVASAGRSARSSTAACGSQTKSSTLSASQ